MRRDRSIAGQVRRTRLENSFPDIYQSFPKTPLLVNRSAAGIDGGHQSENPEVQHLSAHPSRDRVRQKRTRATREWRMTCTEFHKSIFGLSFAFWLNGQIIRQQL